MPKVVDVEQRRPSWPLRWRASSLAPASRVPRCARWPPKPDGRPERSCTTSATSASCSSSRSMSRSIDGARKRAGREMLRPREAIHETLASALPISEESRLHWIVTVAFTAQAHNDKDLATTQRDAYRDFRMYLAGLLVADDPTLEQRRRQRRSRASDRPRRRRRPPGALRPGLVATRAAAAGARRRARSEGVTVGARILAASAPRDLTADDLVLSHFSLGRDHPIDDRIEAASAAGFAGIGLFVGQFRTLQESGMKLEQLATCSPERTSVWPRSRCSQAGRRLDRPTRTGRPSRWSGSSSMRSRAGTSRRSGRTRVRWPMRRTLRCAVRSSGRPRCGRRPRVPPVHQHRRRVRCARHRRTRPADRTAGSASTSGTTPAVRNDLDLIRAIPPELITGVQMSDGPATPDARRLQGRLPPPSCATRRGRLRRRGLRRDAHRHGGRAPWSLEVCNDDVWDGPGRPTTSGAPPTACAAVLAAARRPTISNTTGALMGSIRSLRAHDRRHRARRVAWAWPSPSDWCATAPTSWRRTYQTPASIVSSPRSRGSVGRSDSSPAT